jgi:hypothetical protein
MTSLEGCTPGVTKDASDKDLGISQNSGMPKSMPCAHENDTESGLSDAGPPSPDIAVLADLLATLPDPDRAGIIVDLPQDQRLAIARLLAARIVGGGPPEGR